MAVDTVVLAGGINRIPLYEGYEPGYKALVPFRGRPSIQYVLDALGGAPGIGRVCVCGPEEKLRDVIKEAGRYEFVPGGQTLMESVLHGLRHFQGSKEALFVTADLPLLTPAAISAFLAARPTAATAYRDNVFIGVVPRERFEGEFAAFAKGFNRFRDVAVCHGNLMLASTSLLGNAEAMARIDRIYNARKNPLAAALAVGVRVGMNYAFGVHLLHTVSMAEMARIASRRFGIGIVPILLDYPEVALDVDEPEDYVLTGKILNKRAAGTTAQQNLPN